MVNWTHVYPVNDIKKHTLKGFDCECDPILDLDNQIVIHNAWDIREAQEFVNEFN